MGNLADGRLIAETTIEIGQLKSDEETPMAIRSISRGKSISSNSDAN